MANPQCEDGFTRLANELLEAALRVMSGDELRVWLAVVRRTYGFGRKCAPVRRRELAQMCGISERQVARAVAALVARRMLCREPATGRRGQVLGPQKDYDQWITGKALKGDTDVLPMAGNDDPKFSLVLATGDTAVTLAANAGDTAVTLAGMREDTNVTPMTALGDSGVIPATTHPLEKKKKRKKVPSPEALKISQAYHERMRMLHPTLTRSLDKETDIEGALALEDLVRIDGHDWELIKQVLRWALSDEFWSRNLRSLASVRKRGPSGLPKFENCLSQMDEVLVRTRGQRSQWPTTISRDVPVEDLARRSNCLGWDVQGSAGPTGVAGQDDDVVRDGGAVQTPSACVAVPVARGH